MIANNLYNDPDPKTMAMAEFEKHSLRLDSIKGCNLKRNFLAQKREGIHKRNTYTSFRPKAECEQQGGESIARHVA